MSRSSRSPYREPSVVNWSSGMGGPGCLRCHLTLFSLHHGLHLCIRRASELVASLTSCQAPGRGHLAAFQSTVATCHGPVGIEQPCRVCIVALLCPQGWAARGLQGPAQPGSHMGYQPYKHVPGPGGRGPGNQPAKDICLPIKG